MTVCAAHGRPRTAGARAAPPATTPDHSGEESALGQSNSPVQDLSWLVTDFTKRVPGVEHAAVVSSDGVPLAVSDGIPPGRLENLSAITSGLNSLAGGTAQILAGGAVTQTLVTMEQGVLVIVAISDGSSLAALATVDADLDLVAYEMTVLAEQAYGVLTPDPRRPPAAATTSDTRPEGHAGSPGRRA
jgi:predicted regulator of Ras-like GTPase activity (Roadblock/LC7/MglB family)